MVSTRQRTVQRPSGLGKVLNKDGRVIAEVRYHLVITQTIHIKGALSGTSEDPGLVDARGVLNIVSGKRNLRSSSDSLTLELADGRVWGFFATSGDPVSGQYQVTQADLGTLATGL